RPTPCQELDHAPRFRSTAHATSIDPPGSPRRERGGPCPRSLRRSPRWRRRWWRRLRRGGGGGPRGGVPGAGGGKREGWGGGVGDSVRWAGSVACRPEVVEVEAVATLAAMGWPTRPTWAWPPTTRDTIRPGFPRTVTFTTPPPGNIRPRSSSLFRQPQ